jgi:hypothetical protein
MGKNEETIPILYTSYEQWGLNASSNVIASMINARIIEFTGQSITSEEAKTIAYEVVKMMQYTEKREKVFSLLKERVLKRYKMIFPNEDIIDLMDDHEIYCASVNYLTNKTIAEKVNLDNAIDLALINVEMPGVSASEEEKQNYATEFKKFIKNNKDLLAKQ